MRVKPRDEETTTTTTTTTSGQFSLQRSEGSYGNEETKDGEQVVEGRSKDDEKVVRGQNDGWQQKR